MEQPPELIAIDHDDHHAQHVGRTTDGRQFFLTTPFVPALATEGREFIALYFFDEKGDLLEADIEDLGPRTKLDSETACEKYDRKVEALGEVEYCRIEVCPFQLEKFGVSFGLIPRPPEIEGENWWVIVEPGNYMAFLPPWDSGEYDT